MPALIGILDISSSHKYVMHELIEGFFCSLYHPEKDYTSWNLDSHILIGDTSTVIQEVRSGASYKRVMRRLTEVYEDLLKIRPEVEKCSKHSNISCFYRNKLVKIFR